MRVLMVGAGGVGAVGRRAGGVGAGGVGAGGVGAVAHDRALVRRVVGGGSRLLVAVDHVGPVAAGHVGDPHAVHAAAVVVVEGENLGDLRGPAVLVEHGNVRAGEHQGLDRLPVDLLAEAERGVLDEAEERRLHERLGRLPQVDDWVDFDERRITVREIDGRRVGRVLVSAVPPVVVVDPEHPISIEPPEDAAQ